LEEYILLQIENLEDLKERLEEADRGEFFKGEVDNSVELIENLLEDLRLLCDDD